MISRWLGAYVSCHLFIVKAELEKAQSLPDSDITTNDHTSVSDEKDQSEPRPSNTCMQ